MPQRVLLVTPDDDVRTELLQFVEDSIGGHAREPVKYESVRTRDDAQAHLSLDNYWLLVTELNIPPDSNSAINSDAKLGLSLLEFLKRSEKPIPSIVVADVVDGTTNSALKDYRNCELVEKGTALDVEISKSVGRLGRALKLGEPNAAQAPNTPELYLHVNFDLRRNAQGYGIAFPGSGIPQKWEYLTIDETIFTDLEMDTKSLGGLDAYEDWEQQLKRIGSKFLKHLFDRSAKFRKDFWEAYGRVGSTLDRVRFSFSVTEDVYPIALEAMNEEESLPGFWMLQAPVYRSIIVPTNRFPLYYNREELKFPKNALIIEADTDGFVEGHEGSLPKLPHLISECAWLEKFLLCEDGAPLEANIDKVCRLGRTHKTVRRRNQPTEQEAVTDFRACLKELLSGPDTWHLVHFAGHTFHAANGGNKSAYMSIPGTQPGRNERLNISSFARWLGDSEFLYLSSCQSSDDNVVYQLARENMPAIVGFRWKLDDRMAEEHTRAFYTDLLSQSLSVEYAFLKARQEMHRKFPRDRTWAAPILVFQTGN